METTPLARTVLVVLFDGVQSPDVTGPLEVFVGARTGGEPAYQVLTADPELVAAMRASDLEVVSRL